MQGIDAALHEFSCGVAQTACVPMQVACCVSELCHEAVDMKEHHVSGIHPVFLEGHECPMPERTEYDPQHPPVRATP